MHKITKKRNKLPTFVTNNTADRMFQFRQFSISDNNSAMKIGTDGVLLGSWAFGNLSPARILDIGTGTGLIALMLAQRFPDALITAIEIDPVAASEARANTLHSPWAARITVEQGDFNRHIPDGTYDAIVSNPPFFDETLPSPTAARDIARREKTLTLDSLIERSAGMLSPGGHLALIAPCRRTDSIIYRCAINRLDVDRMTTVAPKSGIEPIRVLLQAVKGSADSYETDRLDIRDTAGAYTDAYRRLTQPFYLPSTFDK